MQNILKRNCNPFSAKAASYFIIYSCVAFGLAGMSKTSYLPTFHTSPDNLGITCQDVEGHFCLGSVEFSDEVKQIFSHSDALVVWQNYKPRNTVIGGSHADGNNCYEGDGFFLINRSVAPGC
jgi:hypothetical protein